MTEDSRPLLALSEPTPSTRPKQTTRDMPRLSKPGPRRQAERLTPQFNDLAAAFEAERARLTTDTPDEVDPALVVVFDLAGSVEAFRNAINQITGLEFLTELLGEPAEPDDDFHMASRDDGRIESNVSHSLYLVMSNASAVGDLVRLFDLWRRDRGIKFDRGLNKFKAAFEQLVAIRPWGPMDRVRETGLLERWKETLSVVGQSSSSVKVEVELWYRSDRETRRAAQSRVEEIVVNSGGHVLDRSQIGAIGYHAVLAELPIQQVQTVLSAGADAIDLLTTDEVMFVSPFTPMSVAPASPDPTAHIDFAPPERLDALPRIALLDGLPFPNHDALSGRLVIDDPDDVSVGYAPSSRNHGTAMASLIIHGDLTAPGDPLDRPVYVRPIMRPHEFFPEREQILPTQLLPDLLHRSVRRIVEGDEGRDPAAPSVRIVNLSIGDENRALVRRMSPVGRLLDWLAHTYNLLFIVSAGNHRDAIAIPADAATDAQTASSAVTRAVYEGGLLRSILPPGDALNALTIGAVHDDGMGEIDVPDTAWDLVENGAPALFSATGPGVGRSIKPDLHHVGGRALYIRPVVEPGDETAGVELAETATSGPGLQVAAPGRMGATNATVFTSGTSNATALVTREASRLFDILEAAETEEGDPPLPDPQYHPLLVRALLTHTCRWHDWGDSLRDALGLDPQVARRRLTAFLGYGGLDTSRLGAGAANRAVLVAGGHIERDQRHTYEIPLPSSLRARAEWHRFTITLAAMVPTVGLLSRYRGARVYFETPDQGRLGGKRIEAEHTSVRRGSLQHEIVDGRRALVFGDDASFPVHVECMDDAERLRAGKTVRYALVVSVETASATSTTIHDEIRERLRQQVRTRGRVGS